MGSSSASVKSAWVSQSLDGTLCAGNVKLPKGKPLTSVGRLMTLYSFN